MAHIRRVAPAGAGDPGRQARRHRLATAEQYAREAFERYQADAVTLSPFMGFDTIEPYLKYPGKGLILLCRTSNPGGSTCRPAPGRYRRPAARVRAHCQAGRKASAARAPTT
jgi:orotidine-5'-phosphate decarboxylase